MNNDAKVIEFKTKKDDLMKQTLETFTSIASQLKICDNPYEEQSKQNILRRDTLEFLRLSQQLLNLSNEIKKHVILNEDIYQINDEYKLSEKDLLETKQNIRQSYEYQQKELEIKMKERYQKEQTLRQQQYLLQQQQNAANAANAANQSSSSAAPNANPNQGVNPQQRQVQQPQQQGGQAPTQQQQQQQQQGHFQQSQAQQFTFNPQNKQ